MRPEDLLFVTFAGAVSALDKKSGETAWVWAIPKGGGYNALLVQGEQLFVSANGYTYCLDARNGTLQWRNDLPGLGVGVPCLALAGAITSGPPLGAAAQQAAASRAAAHS